MDFFKAKQPIALPLHSQDEKLLKDNEELNLEFAVDTPQQEERSNRCCFKKASRGRKAIRRLGHFVVLGAFFYWLWGPSINVRYEGDELQNLHFSDFTDLDEVPGTLPKDFLMVQTPTHSKS